MRVLLVAVMMVVFAGCTCSGCHPAPTAIDAGAVSEAVPDAGALVAEAEEEDDDAGDEDEPDENAALPAEVEQNALSAEALVAAFAKDCHFEATVVFEDMNGPTDAGECGARAFDQNCSPDQFGCWDESEKCKDACAQPCGSCEAQCATTCDRCKAKCTNGSCTTTCAEQRNGCRLSCLRRLEQCRGGDCQAALDRCDADALERTQARCPDCEALRSCQLTALDAKTEPALCLQQFPKNAAECLEWCSPGE